MAPFEAYLFWGTLIMYCMSIAAYSFGMVFQRRERPWTWGARLMALGLGLHTGAIAVRWYVTGHVPTVDNYENTLVFAFFVVGFTVWFAFRYPAMRAAGLFILPVAVLAMGFGVMTQPRLGPMAASLKSWWLYIHIFFAWLVTGAMSFAFGASIVYLIKEGRERKGTVTHFFERVPSIERIEELIYRNVVYGFVAYAMMIGSGALWARDLWGSYWSWDPVETWSLSSWMIYGLILHLRFTFGWGGRRMAWMVIFALISVLIVMFGVNFAVESSRHIFNIQ